MSCRSIVAIRVGCRGFTLFELLVVLFIIGIMATLVGPRLTGSLPSLRVKTAAKQTAALLRNARSRAVTENLLYQSNFDLIANHLIVSPKKEETTEAPEESTQIVRPIEFKLPEGVFFKTEGREEQFTVNFFPGGGSSGGQIILANKKGTTWQITVDNITGSVSLSDGK